MILIVMSQLMTFDELWILLIKLSGKIIITSNMKLLQMIDDIM